MFSCPACLRRAYISLLSSASPEISSSSSRLTITSAPLLRQPSPIALSSQQRRTLSNFATITQGHHRRDIRKALRSKEPVQGNKTRSKVSRVALRDETARTRNRALISSKDASTSTISIQARQEAEYLRDPLKLAKAVLDKLRKDQPMAAVELVRASEKVPGDMTGTGGNVVSWNHLCDWFWSRSDEQMAAKLYHEMKKRGHKPDAHTYTIMLRGYANLAKRRAKTSVQGAMKIWNNLVQEKSGVTPNTIHLNSVVSVCAKALDMDALWEVIRQVPETGVGAADAWTYTTVLNALQAGALKKAAEISEQDHQARLPIPRSRDHDGSAEDQEPKWLKLNKTFHHAVRNGKQLWTEIVLRWRKGELVMDERLVCSMGRLLMTSPYQNSLLDIFSLAAQTMGLQNFRASVARQLPPGSIDTRFEDEDGIIKTADELRDDKALDDVRQDDAAPELHVEVFNAISITDLSSPTAYALPGNNTLSLLIEAATLLKAPGVGKKYWDTLTDETGSYTVSPDAQNLTAYLRLLRISRASRLAAELITADYSDGKVLTDFLGKRGTYVMAMSCCARDKNNQNVFGNAEKILDVMEERLEDGGLEMKTLGIFIDLAVITTPGLLNGREAKERGVRSDQNMFVPDSKTNNAMRMLDRIGLEIGQLRRLLVNKVQDDGMTRSMRGGWKKQLRQFVDKMGEAGKASAEEVGGVLRTLNAACDRVIKVATVDDGKRVSLTGDMDEKAWSKYVKDVTDMKRELSSFIFKMLGKPPLEIKASYEGAGRHPTANSMRLRDAEREHGDEDELDSNAIDVEDDEVEKAVPLKRKIYRTLTSGRIDHERPRPQTKLYLNARRGLNEVRRKKRQTIAAAAVAPVRRGPTAPERYGSNKKKEKVRAVGRQLGGRERWRDNTGEDSLDDGIERTRAARPAQKSGMVQPGWGGGFEELSRRQGGGRGQFVQI